MSGKLAFLADSSDSETEIEIKTNEKYATAYNLWRNKEELQKYKDLKKEDSESSSESEEEELPESDDFFRAISLIKSKDSRIFEEGFELFKSEEVGKKSKTVKEKPMYMKDYERSLVLERGGKFSDEDEDAPKIFTYDAEQEDLKKSFKKELEDSDAEDDFLQVRSKTQKEEEAEEADYLRWLKGEDREVSEDIKKDMSSLRNYWNDPKLDEGEKFLRDYILKKKYLEEDDSEIPTYEEITSGMLSDDEKMLEEHEKFEHKYNFRFEEPDEEFIKRYPRTVGDSLRKADNRRKQKREEISERKRREKEQRQEELKRLKALKRKEIEEKFSKLKEICGQEEINLNESDIESDFDPDKHDQKMKEMFNDDYYNVEEDQKPEFPFDEELESENWNTWTAQKIIKTEDFNQEVDDNEIDTQENDKAIYQSKININPKEEFEREMIEASLSKRKPKKKSLFAKVASQSKPLYDPDGKSFDEYLDEYYKLDYEDVIGDLPVRYKYRKVVPNDFGLTVDEILAADDRELNQWCSVKKTCQYRNDDEEFYDVQAFKKKAQNVLTKKKVFTSLYAPKDENEIEVDVKIPMKNNFTPETCSSASIDSENIEICLKQSNTNEDMEQKSNTNEDMEQRSNKDFPIEYNDYKKKSKKNKKKEKANSSLVNTELDYSNADMDFDTSENGLESSNSFQCNTYEDGEDKLCDSSVHNEHKKKSKKKKQGIPDMKTERQYSDLTGNTEAYSGENNQELSILGESSFHKQTKKKRKLDEDFAPSADELNIKRKRDNTNLTNESSPTSMNSHPSSFNNSACIKSSPNSNFVSESSSQKLKRKKKKNKNRKNKNDSSSNVLNCNQNNKPTAHKFSKKHVEQVSSDKRLGLSDERLAAYNINPKKFKNRIIYSKK